MRHCQRQLVWDYMNIETCAVCDQTIEEHNLRSVHETKKFSENCVKRLGPIDGLAEGLKEFYDICEKIPCLKVALISTRAEKVRLEIKYQ